MQKDYRTNPYTLYAWKIPSPSSQILGADACYSLIPPLEG
jgi:hypothetical protein